MVENTGGHIDKAALLADVIAAMFGSREASERIRTRQREEMDRRVLEPARAYRAAHPDSRPYSFGDQAHREIRAAAKDPGTATGMMFLLMEDILTRFTPGGLEQSSPRERELLGKVAALEGELAAKQAQTQPTDLDWSTLRAERDALASELAKRERELEQLREDVLQRDLALDSAREEADQLREDLNHAVRSRDVEAQTGLQLAATLRQRDEERARLLQVQGTLRKGLAEQREEITRLGEKVTSLESALADTEQHDEETGGES
jgi:hypothetical protein